ncbi:Vacuolar protein sorting-associated protein 62 [Vermiconidia calcicola]|uniref:Vacuolar protein sorting-associated protein 62 n=1 Tax=Vermiconidia calcicola TaxID=1690605 RepID=A0ACC3NJB3_9PEZI|nr:Vacuolar protein sorting-associated protein 62 [Vermiconidia calcicola]
MKRPGPKSFFAFLAITLCYIILTGVGVHLTSSSNPSEKHENAEWIATGRHWLDRQMCRWFGTCGTLHLKKSGWTWPGVDDDLPPSLPDFSKFWESGEADPDSWSDEEKAKRDIPQYVYDYAPYVHLFSGESFWPGDLAEHLVHTSPHVNHTKILDLDHHRNLTNLHELNDYECGVHGKFTHVFLQSEDNVEERPSWLTGIKNIPSAARVVDEEEDDDPIWPDSDDSKHYDTAPHNHQSQVELAETSKTINAEDWDLGWPALTKSENGRCGGYSGFTCKGSKFGHCCSIYGWCGKGDAFCGQACDPVAGKCNDPFEPLPKPRSDLRRRGLQVTNRGREPSPAGKSSAPAILVVVPKDDGIVDAFWFFFYSFNLGQKVFNIRFGNHIGDWEHTLIRFKDGKPISAAVSEHDFGAAWAWEALEKYLPNPDGSRTVIGSWSNVTAARLAKRPVVYSATGTHAMYTTPGVQPYVLPWGILHDQTDRGPLWDPSLNVRSYTYDLETKEFRASTRNPKVPTSWFDFAGHWGDKFYPLSDPRQYRFAGEFHYVNGPPGPRWKGLHRKHVCQHGRRCHIKHWVNDGRVRRLPLPDGDVEEWIAGS